MHCSLGCLRLRELLGNLDKQLRHVLVGLGTCLHEQAVVAISIRLRSLLEKRGRKNDNGMVPNASKKNREGKNRL